MRRTTLLALVVSVIILTGSIACLRRGRPSSRPDQNERTVISTVVPQPESSIRNIVLISMDTTRWDVLSPYNAPELNSPNTGSLAREGVVFERAYAPMPVTLPSHASMLTGKIPPAHGVLDNGRYALADEHVTLAEIVKAHGFNTAAFVSALVMESKFGLDQGFDTYDDGIDEAALIGERRGDVTTAHAIAWLEEHKSEKNFVFLHLFDPHAPYEAPEPFASEIRASYPAFPEFMQAYIAEVAFADHCIGMLVRKLKELGLYENALICVTADHGESLTDHGENTHGFFIYSSTIQVPLIFKVPGSNVPRRVADPVGIIDIPPTILSLLGVRFDRSIQGRDLAGPVRGTGRLEPGSAVFSMSLEPRKYGGSALLGIIVGDFKYIQAPRPELYDLSRDIRERENLAEIDPERARQLRERIEEIVDTASPETIREKISADADTIRLLESLGYVMTTGHDDTVSIDGTAVDAKDLIEYHNKVLAAMSYAAPENLGAALAACEDMIRMRPDFYLGYLMMGRALLAAGRQDEAYPFFERAHALGPKNPA